QGHLQQRRRQPPQEQRRQREDHAARYRARRRTDGLRHVGFEDARTDAYPAQCLEGRHRHHRDGNRSADGQSGAQAEIGVRRTEDDAEQDAEEQRLERELMRRLGGGNIGLVFLARPQGPVRGVGKATWLHGVTPGCDVMWRARLPQEGMPRQRNGPASGAVATQKMKRNDQSATARRAWTAPLPCTSSFFLRPKSTAVRSSSRTTSRGCIWPPFLPMISAATPEACGAASTPEACGAAMDVPPDQAQPPEEVENTRSKTQQLCNTPATMHNSSPG